VQQTISFSRLCIVAGTPKQVMTSLPSCDPKQKLQFYHS
jgi:hypothetical protein